MALALPLERLPRSGRCTLRRQTGKGATDALVIHESESRFEHSVGAVLQINRCAQDVVHCGPGTFVGFADPDREVKIA